MNPPGGIGGGGSDEDVEADKSRRDSELRARREEEDDNTVLDAEEIDGVIPPADADVDEPQEGSVDYPSPIQGERLDLVLRTPSPSVPDSAAGTGSIPDDTPSLKGSQASFPLTGTPSPRGSISRTPSGAIKPFERRFQSRFSTSPSPSRVASPSIFNFHSRQSSAATQAFSANGDGHEGEQAPWEVVRWTRLRKITGQAFSEIGKRQLGTPTCLAVSASIVIGTSKGLILVFDYHQNLKGIIGQGTKAMESGPISSLAISADHTSIAGGHTSGNIFTWEIAKPAKPFLTIPAITRKDRESSAEGHISGRAVLHIGFLGTRHTALVSADDGGMAFSHMASRGFGVIARSVTSTRLLGRYPTFRIEEDKQRKPSSVLAFAPLPLGNVEQATDDMGLTALLTPYLLVVVSTIPLAQTQYKAARPKDAAPHGAMSGCLAWFPAVKLKTPLDGKSSSLSKLVYCWSDVLAVLEVEIGRANINDQDKQPSLTFKHKGRWKSEESIVAVQWLSRSVIAVLTISQRLIILEDGELNVMDSVDLLQRHIFHRDFFSNQLHTVVEQDEQDADIHGVVADGFYMSFKTYKGKLFLLGFSDLSVGTLSNWADRLTALMEHGDDIAAIDLALGYYQGVKGHVSVGLPEHAESRHELIRDRLVELLTASLRFRLSQRAADQARLQELTDRCFDVCLVMDEVELLLDDIYELYSDGDQSELFIDTLESHIMEGDIHSLPPTLVKDVVDHYAALQKEIRLEEMLCQLDAQLFDIDQVTRLCKQHFLYDALIHVWNQALNDWVTPLADLFSLICDQQLPTDTNDYDYEDRKDAALKVFPYLAFSLTGRYYPKGDLMDDDLADTVRKDLYGILFSAQTVAWPPGSNTVIRSVPSTGAEQAYPYLRLLLHFDAANFMSMMNEAFEDAYLNTDQESDYSGAIRTNGSSTRMTRQQIVSILLVIMAEEEFGVDQTVYLDIFIARSLPKYPQFLILSGSELQLILRRLTAVEDDDLVDECQLSVEYLLSVYHPPITEDLLGALHNARYFRVLKSIYRSEIRWLDFVKASFEDVSGRESLFPDVTEALRAMSGNKQKTELESLVCTHAETLVFHDLKQTVNLVLQYMPDRLDDFVEALGQSRLQYTFLQELLEPASGPSGLLSADSSSALASRLSDQYIALMCVHDPTHVADYVSAIESGNLHLDVVLPHLEKNGIVDASVLLLTKDGLAREAMDRLVKHAKSLQKALCSLIDSAVDTPDSDGLELAIKEMQQEVEKYIKLGIWLCNGQASIAAKTPGSPKINRKRDQDVSENELTLDEYLWLTLVDQVVQISQAITFATDALESPISGPVHTNAVLPSRALVQQVFTALLASTTTPASTSPTSSFLTIFRLFLARAALTTPSLSDLRAILVDIFAAYAYESDVLALASRLLDADAFAQLSHVAARRGTGWRPRAQVCDSCKRRAYGPGVGEAVFGAWAAREASRRQRKAVQEGKGKGRGEAVEEDRPAEGDAAFTLVVFACRHVFHRECLSERDRDDGGRYTCPVCSPKEAAVSI